MIAKTKPVYILPEEMDRRLQAKPAFRPYLYCRGFLLTTEKQTDLSQYPFYSQWKPYEMTVGSVKVYIYAHRDTPVHLYTSASRCLFIIGHAYDPYRQMIDETEILRDLDGALSCRESAFWDREGDLTGIFCMGYVTERTVTYTTDCCGMQIVYHGVVNGKLYAASHSKLIADLLGLEQSPYVKRLIADRFWPMWGMWLPGDVSPFAELKRMVPNHCADYYADTCLETVRRYYPLQKISESEGEEAFASTIEELCTVLQDSLTCIARKWPDRKIGLSVTGGRDSTTTLACVGENADRFSYFSYSSDKAEQADTEAAGKILAHVGLLHDVYTIPAQEPAEDREDMELFRTILAVNCGCVGYHSENDVRKRFAFLRRAPCDIEIKSWVNEMGRAWEYNKYRKNRFPKKPYPAYWRAMHKIYLTPYLIHQTDRVFKEYLERYYTEKDFENIPWTELYFWEFAWSAYEGLSISGEQRVNYDMTVPYNNRRYVEKMLTIPLPLRIRDEMPRAMIARMNPKIAETNIVVRDLAHTNLRSFVLRIYLEWMSKIRF